MNTTPTDEQLKLALAKMLPEKIWFTEQPKFYWRPDYTEDGCIKETEWLHVCWLAEQTLNENEIWAYPAMTFATWQQRAQALAKVKGVEI